MDDERDDIETGFAQHPDGNPRHYCRHGVYIGSPYGADILCPWCESGEEPPTPPSRTVRARLWTGPTITWELYQRREVGGLQTVDMLIECTDADLPLVRECLRAAVASGYVPSDYTTETVIIVLDAAYGVQQQKERTHVAQPSA